MVKRLSLISERIGCTSRFGLDLDQADTARKMSTWHCDITEHFSFHTSEIVYLGSAKRVPGYYLLQSNLRNSKEGLVIQNLNINQSQICTPIIHVQSMFIFLASRACRSMKTSAAVDRVSSWLTKISIEAFNCSSKRVPGRVRLCHRSSTLSGH